MGRRPFEQYSRNKRPMLKFWTVILLIITTFIYYLRGFVSPYEVGKNTLYFGITYFLFWAMSLMVFLLLPSKWGALAKSFSMGICCLYFLEFIYQILIRYQGFSPENNLMTIGVFIVISTAVSLIYIFQKRWKKLLQ